MARLIIDPFFTKETETGNNTVNGIDFMCPLIHPAMPIYAVAKVAGTFNGATSTLTIKTAAQPGGSYTTLASFGAITAAGYKGIVFSIGALVAQNISEDLYRSPGKGLFNRVFLRATQVMSATGGSTSLDTRIAIYFDVTSEPIIVALMKQGAVITETTDVLLAAIQPTWVTS